MDDKNRGVVFGDESEWSRVTGTQRVVDTSGLAGLVIKISGGRIKDKSKANVVLLIFAVVIIMVSIVLIFLALRPAKEIKREDLPFVPSAGPQLPDFHKI